MKENRIVFVDYLRVVACFLVMLVHASENFYAADASGLAGNVSMLANEQNRFWVAFYLVAAIAAQRYATVREKASLTVAECDMRAIRDAFVGSAAAETPDFDLRDAKDFDLACAGIPVTVAESGTKVWYLTDKSRREMTEADKAVLASGAVVEVDDVGKYPLASRRTKLLDDLDAATDGTFPVRIDACRPLRILPRVRDDGRLDSVTILNLSIGDTDELMIRVRRPVSRQVTMQNAKMAEPTSLPCVPSTLSDEFIITLDNIPGWQIVSLFFD